MNLSRNNQIAAFLTWSRYQEIATADLQQTAQSSLHVIQFLEKCDTILQSPFLRYERFEPYASFELIIGLISWKLPT